MNTYYPKMKQLPVTSFNIHTTRVSQSVGSVSPSESTSIGPVSPSEQPNRPRFRANFSHWGPVGLYLKPNPVRAVLKLPKTCPIEVRAGLTTPRTDQMFGLMPILVGPML